MRQRIASAVLLLACAPAALPQSKVKLEFDAEREVSTFVLPRRVTAPPKELQTARGKVIEVQLPASGTLHVWDRKTGNMALRPVESVPPAWRLKPRDFTAIGLVTVRVEHRGSPVAGARVTLKDPLREQSQVIDSSSGGEAEFFGVAPGEAKVTVEYRSGGQPAPMVDQLFPLELDRTLPDPLLTISLPMPVQTVGATDVVGAGEKADEARRENPWVSLLIYAVALALIVALGYWLIRYARTNPKKLADTLAKVGVPVPDPSAPPTTGAPPPLTGSVPQQKILLGDAAPVAAPPPMATVLTEPRLVKDTGEFVVLDEGEHVVGRDYGLGISLLGETTVSRRHAMVTRRGLSVSLRDLGSTNGTYVNGRKVDSDVELRAGDQVQFGAVRFRLEA